MTSSVPAFLRRHRNAAFVLAVFIFAAGTYYLSVLSETSTSDPQSMPELAELASSSVRSFEEYADYFRRLADDKGAVYAFDVLKYATLAPGTDLHLLAHVVGDKLYEQEGMEGIYECTQDFRNACSHSVVIGILNEFGEGALDEIADTCRKAPGGAGAYTMCFHGLGHGVLAFNGYKFDQAVTMCAKTGTAEYRNREYIECVGGVSMEMVAGVHDPEVWKTQVATYFKDNDVLYPCTASFMPDEVQPICLMHVTPRLFEAAGMDLGRPDPSVLPEAFSYCDALPPDDVANREACYGGFGKEFIGFVQHKDVRNVGAIPEASLRLMRSWCEMAGNEFGERECNAYLLASLYWGGENEVDASLAFCASAQGEAKEQCYHQLVGHMRFYFPNSADRVRRCLTLPPEYEGACRAP